MKVGVLGAGVVAQVMARLFGTASSLHIWADDLDAARAALEFPGCQFCPTVAAAAEDAALLVITMSVRKLRRVAALLGPVVSADQVALLCARGVEMGFVLPHQVLRQETCLRKIGVLGGPLHTSERPVGQPATLVVASRFAEGVSQVRVAAGGAAVIYASRDVVGVQVASALANVTAIALGMAAGVGMGDGVRAVLLTRGLGEASQLGRALGADAATFTGLAGVGALMPHDGVVVARHMLLGEQLATGLPENTARNVLRRDVEGLMTAREALLLAAEYGLELPLVQAVDRVARGLEGAAAALASVLQHDLNFAGQLG